MKIIPAIDIMDGRCVRLFQGDYNQQKVYGESPLSMAKYFEDCGADKIHIVDLDGAKAKKIVNWDSIREISASVKIPVEIGGGIRSREDIIKLKEMGVAQVILGSIAVKEPEILEVFLREFGADFVIVGIDAKDGKVKISGWQECAQIDVPDMITDMVKLGVTTIIYTDISRDGTLTSPNFDAYTDLCANYPTTHFVASGGVSSEEDIEKLYKIGVSGTILGKAIYENKVDLKSVSKKNYSLS